jgi:hypothetical protein
MTTTHVFIVDTNTFKYHLENLFAGTGAKDINVDFNNVDNTSLRHNVEKTLVSMIADLERIRIGDYIIFYLQQERAEEVYDGKFYGIFKVSDKPFLDNLNYLTNKTLKLSNSYDFEFPKSDRKFKIKNNVVSMTTALTKKEEINLLKKFISEQDKNKIKQFEETFYRNNQFLLRSLEKSLTFRTLIEPFEVYAKGVTEWEALDEIKHIQSPNQMLWSLIYRKLKGNRGNTMITIYESERLFKLLRDKNSRQVLSTNNFTFDIETQEIRADSIAHNYTGRKEKINILPRLIKKHNDKEVFETHLQAYIVQNIGRGTNKDLDRCLLSGLNFEWLGNEVSCGVGMQRIDVMLSLTKNNTKVVLPIELKSIEADTGNIIQIQRYVDWLEQYYIPNRISDIQPVLISKKIPDKNSENYKEIIESFKQFNTKNTRCVPIKYIEYELENDNLKFDEIKYQ